MPDWYWINTLLNYERYALINADISNFMGAQIIAGYIVWTNQHVGDFVDLDIHLLNESFKVDSVTWNTAPEYNPEVIGHKDNYESPETSGGYWIGERLGIDITATLQSILDGETPYYGFLAKCSMESITEGQPEDFYGENNEFIRSFAWGIQIITADPLPPGHIKIVGEPDSNLNAKVGEELEINLYSDQSGLYWETGAIPWISAEYYGQGLLNGTYGRYPEFGTYYAPLSFAGRDLDFATMTDDQNSSISFRGTPTTAGTYSMMLELRGSTGIIFENITIEVTDDRGPITIAMDNLGLDWLMLHYRLVLGGLSILAGAIAIITRHPFPIILTVLLFCVDCYLYMPEIVQLAGL